MKSKKEDTIQGPSPMVTNNGKGSKNYKPLRQGPKSTQSRPSEKSRYVGVTHDKIAVKDGDLRQQQDTQPTTRTATTRSGGSMIATRTGRDKSRTKTSEQLQMSTVTLHNNAMRSSSSVPGRASSGELGTRAKQSRVCEEGNNRAYSQQQGPQISGRSINTPAGGLLPGSQSMLDGLTPDIVRTLTSLLMTRATGGPQSQPQQSSGGAFLGATGVPRSDLGLRWSQLQGNPAVGVLHPPASYLPPPAPARQSPFVAGDVSTRAASSAEAMLQQELLSLIVRRGHQASHVPSTIWHQHPHPQDLLFQLDSLLENVGNTITAQSSNRQLSDLAASTLASGAPTANQNQATAVGNHQFRSSYLDDRSTEETSKQQEERKPSRLSQIGDPASCQRDDEGENMDTVTSEHPGAITSKIVLPCGARGMPPEHNFQNAFLVINSQTRHGDELMCSYRPCREGGVKFRYCSVCRLPVAKRNFHQRHSHGLATAQPRGTALLPVLPVVGDSGSRNESVAGGPATTTTQQLEAATSAAQTTRSMHHEQEEDEGSVVVHDEVDEGKKQSLLHDGHLQKSNKKRRTAEDVVLPGGDSRLATEGKNSYAKSSTLAREREWVSLLHRRPPSSDTKAISKWLFEVMSVSELPESPLEHEYAQESSNADSHPGGGDAQSEESMTGVTLIDGEAQRPIVDSPNDSDASFHDGKKQKSVSSVRESRTGTSQKHNGRLLQKDHDSPHRAKKRKQALHNM